MRKKTKDLRDGDIIEYAVNDWRTVCGDPEIDGDSCAVHLTKGTTCVAHSDALWRCRKLITIIRVYSDGYVESGRPR